MKTIFIIYCLRLTVKMQLQNKRIKRIFHRNHMVQTLEEIKSSGLTYATDSQPGIYRKGKPGKFYYEDKDGNRISDEDQLARIKSLVIPPAWTNVWIANRKSAYLQVTGMQQVGNNTNTIQTGPRAGQTANTSVCWSLAKYFRRHAKE
jgi:DNA topoisomerase IB